MKKIVCDTLLPGCPFTATAQTEEELLERLKVHAKLMHGIAEVGPELRDKVQQALRAQK